MALTMLVKDFSSLKEYEENGLLAEEKTTYRKELWGLIISKSLYLIIFIGAPIVVGALNFFESFAYFMVVQLVTGFILSVIFQLAHVVEEAQHPQPNAGGNIENEWMIHQLETTVNFCPRNPMLNWYTGGLNYQVEHHLFPNISHIHYPALSKIVRETAEEFGVVYNQIDTFSEIFSSHIRFLKKLGEEPVPAEKTEAPAPELVEA